MSGISEMTSNIEQQRTILNNLVENKFNGVISRGLTNDQIFEYARTYAKSKLESEVEALKMQNAELNTKQDKLTTDIHSHKEAVSSEIQQLRDEKIGIGSKLSEKEQENIRLKASLIEKEEKEELKKWQRPAKWLMALGLLIIGFTLLQFCCKTWTYNYPYQMIIWIDTITNTVQKNTLTLLMYAPLIGLWLISVFVWNRLVPSKDKKEQKKIIGNELIEKYK